MNKILKKYIKQDISIVKLLTKMKIVKKVWAFSQRQRKLSVISQGARKARFDYTSCKNLRVTCLHAPPLQFVLSQIIHNYA